MSVSLHHRLEGPPGAPVLLLANSLGTDLTMWDAVTDDLVGECAVLRFDHRGQGGSPAPPGRPGIGDLGDDVLALLDGLGIDRVSVAGVSIGGMLAAWLGANAPERVDRLMLFCSSAHPGSPETWRQRATTVRSAASVAPIADSVVARWLTEPFAATHPAVGNRLVEMLAASPPEGYTVLCELLVELDLRDDLARITAPTLVVAGAQDSALPAPHSERIAAGIDGARLVVLDPGAHIPMVERPATVAGLIRDHLRG